MLTFLIVLLALSVAFLLFMLGYLFEKYKYYERKEKERYAKEIKPDRKSD